MAQLPLPQGATVNGYRIARVLGRGGFGITYLVHDLLNQPFAIKEYFPSDFATREGMTVLSPSAEAAPMFEECRDRFLREAQALVRLAGKSDGIVPVRTYFEAHGTCYLVMDYIEGASLASVLRKEPAGLPAARVRSLLTQLLSSVGVIHQAGLMHRDIKPGNIILRDDGRVILIDFGSSREASSAHTTAYTQIFSPGFAPLEQMLGLRQSPLSDIFAIGAVCYHAIGGTMVDALARHHALVAGRPDPLPSAERIGSGRYPRRLLRVIDAALAIDPEQRPRSANDMIAALGPAEPEGEPTLITPPASVAPVRRFGVWSMAASAVVLALAGAAYFVPWHSISPPRSDGRDTAQGETALAEEAKRAASQREAAQREAAKQEAAQRETAQREAAQREAAQRETAQREAAQRDAAQREAAQHEAARRGNGTTGNGAAGSGTTGSSAAGGGTARRSTARGSTTGSSTARGGATRGGTDRAA